MYTAHRARLEQNIAGAHRAISRAIDAAESDGDQGMADDLRQVQGQLTFLGNASLRGKARRSLLSGGQIPGQLRIAP